MNLSVSYINKAFSRCRAKSGSSGSITAKGVCGVSHTLHLDSLKAESAHLLSVIRQLPEQMFLSRNPSGAPWPRICASGSCFDGCSQETIDHLVAMGTALGMIRIVGYDAVATDIPVIVVDDIRLVREGKLTRDGFVKSPRVKRVLTK